MVDKELLQAISQLLDEKITPLKKDIEAAKAATENETNKKLDELIKMADDIKTRLEVQDVYRNIQKAKLPS